MILRTNRRKFLKTTAALGVGFWAAGGVSPRPSRAANEEITLACIGVGGKGQSDSADAARSRNARIVAICDVDDDTIAKKMADPDFKKATVYHDYRKMLDDMGKSITAVTVSTPDHHHATASVMAMKMGIHCFCQKPLTHSIYEARVMGALARERKLATQMGNQGTAEYALRKSAALIKSGVIGTVKEVHVWTNRPVWPQGEPRPEKPDEIPSHVHWPEWVGPAKFRHYNEGIYHPFKWRGWWDFGTGALGDMACHTLNMPFMALNLRDPVSVQALTSGHNKDYYPKWSAIDFEFPAIGDRPAVKMIWYDGGKRPSDDLLPSSEHLRALTRFASKRDQERFVDDQAWNREYGNKTRSGSLIVGDKGTLFSAGDYGGDQNYTCILQGKEWVSQEDEVFKRVEFERSPGHFVEFIDAIRTGTPATSNFPDYAGPLTETVLLGNLAVWAAAEAEQRGKKVQWNAKKMQALNGDQETAEIIRHTYHNGYKLDYEV